MIEIERKFLVNASLLPDLSQFNSRGLRQGYFCSSERNTIRIRLAGEEAFLTIKSKTVGLTRAEFEYAVPLEDAKKMLPLCGDNIVKKTRYLIPKGLHTWELDIFTGKFNGLILAEIELSSEDETIELPEWISKEVSMDARYFNSNLADMSAEEATLLVGS